MNYSFLIAAILGLSSILLGGYTDHVLHDQLNPADLESWYVALGYHRLYAVILLFFAALEWLPIRPMLGGLHWLVGLFSLGILLFSGSIYLRILTGSDIFMMLTPFGGTLLIAAWVGTLLAALLWRK